jgi:UDPglucose 6-dehydrogenase
MNKKVTIFGVGKLGVCFALNLDRVGYSVLGVDVHTGYVDSLNSKTLKSPEESVEAMLQRSKNFTATTDVDEGLEYSDTLFVLVATPSLDNGKYDHSQIDRLADQLIERGRQEITKDLIIGCTTMPGYCDELQERLAEYNYKVSYNPEFIAQGTVIRDQQYPDMVLIGSPDENSAAKIAAIYDDMTINTPSIFTMSPLSAEICKVSLNCFITTKIAFTNMIGDLATKVGAEPQRILNAIGADTRVGSKCILYGYGYGGPCFPRDNRALGIYAKEQGCSIGISDATDECNADHLQYMIESFAGDEFVIDSVSYKPQSTMIEESQQLAYAVGLAKKGVSVKIIERAIVLDQVKEIYGDLFTYEQR